MTIHHSTIKKAEKMGVQLSEEGDTVRAFWPKRAYAVHGASSSDAMAQMQAAMVLLEGGEYRIDNPNEARIGTIIREADGFILKGSPMPPVAAHEAIVLKKNAEWENPDVHGSDRTEPADTGDAGGDNPAGVTTDPKEDNAPATIARSENGIALDGGIAYREGTPAGDNPFSTEEDEEEYERATKWDEEWDAAADASEAEEGEKGGSVVNEKYRAKYAELGHPEHCGDWLANIFNNLVKTKEGTDVARVDDIAAANGVDNSKYDRTRPGWQGRLRMTTRNLLARVIWINNGVFRVPDGENIVEYKAPDDWMANQRFKKPKGAETPAAE